MNLSEEVAVAGYAPGCRLGVCRGDIGGKEPWYPLLEHVVDEGRVVSKDVAVTACPHPRIGVRWEVVDEDGAVGLYVADELESPVAELGLVVGAVLPRGNDHVESVVEGVDPSDVVEEIGIHRDEGMPTASGSSPPQRLVDGGVEGQRAAQFEHVPMDGFGRVGETVGDLLGDLA
jgi:hypothetical protein